MATIDLMLSARNYDPDLGLLRKLIVLDRAPQTTEVIVRTEYDRAVRVYIDHKTLYLIAFDFGTGPWRFPDPGFPPVPGARVLEFGESYQQLGMDEGNIQLSAGLLNAAVNNLSFHKPSMKGSEILRGQKHDLIRIIFAVSEALRFWTLQRDVSNLLKNPGTSLCINDYAGSGKPLNSWGTWSEHTNWPEKGVFVPKV